MVEDNKGILEKANKAITEGDNESFLSFCTDDIEWTFVGDLILRGKEAIWQYMAMVYIEPPKFIVENLISEGDFVTALGKIRLKDRDGKMAELKAFVIKTD
ncbi:nuclear transport factor 2 family protein [Pontibacter sp. 13R65]|uniref:nuclear transport factor 2 family protein n=1 Tax=Pontibacter sp. 13R65 TaxID=3127458 RepID=UPI00301E5427